MKKSDIAAVVAGVALAAGAAALEPVSPQPARPLTYSAPGYSKITPDVARAMMEKGGVTVIDVREEDEFEEGHIKGSVNVPLSVFRPGMTLEAVPDKSSPVLLLCRSGVRAERAARVLIESGYKSVYNFYGTLQWPYGLVK